MPARPVRPNRESIARSGIFPGSSTGVSMEIEGPISTAASMDRVGMGFRLVHRKNMGGPRKGVERKVEWDAARRVPATSY